MPPAPPRRAMSNAARSRAEAAQLVIKDHLVADPTLLLSHADTSETHVSLKRALAIPSKSAASFWFVHTVVMKVTIQSLANVRG